MPDHHRSSIDTVEAHALLALSNRIRALSASTPLKVLTSQGDGSPLDIAFHGRNRDSSESQTAVRILKGRRPNSGEHTLVPIDYPTRLAD